VLLLELGLRSAAAREDVLCVFTGGEPLLQLDSALLNKVQAEFGLFMCCETNGTVLPKQQVLSLLDWVTYSPKYGTDSCLRYDDVSEVKVVLDGKQDPSKYVKTAPLRYVQPCYCEDAVRRQENIKNAVQYVLQHPEWMLSVQLQRFLKII
jgi:7-carboxy-7-deazaguanine synthase